MTISNTGVLQLQAQLYSAICQVKILCRAFDAMSEEHEDEDEVNGLTEGLSDVVDQLEGVHNTLDAFKKPVALHVVANVAQTVNS